MRIVKEKPQSEGGQTIVCQSCGATIEYVPNDVRTLWSGTDYGGGPDGAMGFNCPKCGKEVHTKRW